MKLQLLEAFPFSLAMNQHGYDCYAGRGQLRASVRSRKEMICEVAIGNFRIATRKLAYPLFRDWDK